jgi:hypothetical protein
VYRSFAWHLAWLAALLLLLPANVSAAHLAVDAERSVISRILATRGADSGASIRLTDGSLVALNAGSEFAIEQLRIADDPSAGTPPAPWRAPRTTPGR